MIRGLLNVQGKTFVNLTEGANAYKSVINSLPYQDPDTTKLANPVAITELVLDYNSGFDRNTSTAHEGGIQLLSNIGNNDNYKSILFKLEKNGNYITFRGKKYWVGNNKLPLKELLIRSNFNETRCH